MDDIVERLRHTAWLADEGEPYADDLAEAADEIQRLRKELDLKGCRLDDTLNGKERLRRRPLGIVSGRRSAELLRDALERLGLLPEEKVQNG